MLVLARFRVPDTDRAFEADSREAIGLLSAAAGLQQIDLVRNLDDPSLWALVMRWQDARSWRRAFSGIPAKMVLTPFFARMIDEPSAYDSADEVGTNRPRTQP